MAYNVPVISQRTLNMCWEACGHMMWDWYYRRNPTRRGRYTQQAGAYATMNTGLSEQQMDTFYRLLGLRALPHPHGRNVRHALRWTPVIITSGDQVQGHAMVVTGYNQGDYSIINPCAQEVIDFGGGGDTCTGGTVTLSASQADARLGGRIWYW